MNRRVSPSELLCVVVTAALLAAVSPARGDEKFDKLIEEGSYDKAIEYAEEKIPASSRTVADWVKLSRAYRHVKGVKDATAKAKQCLESAQKSNPSDPLVYLGFGRFEYEQKNFEAAQKHFMKSYLLKRSAPAAEGIAVSSAKLKQWDKARDAAESAVNLDSTVHHSRLILAKLYLKDNDYKAAAEQLEHIVVKESADVTHWKNLARCYEHLGNKEGLAKVDPTIIKLDPKNVTSRKRHAEYSLARQDTTTALKLYKELAILDADDPSTFKQLYAIAGARDEVKDATLYLKNYLVLDSTNAEYQRALGDLLYRQEDLEGAIAAYRKTLALDPKADKLYKRYLDALLKRGKKDEAASVMPAAIAAGEVDARLYEAVGDIHREKKQFAKAVEMYQGALESDAKNVRVLTALAQCQAKAGSPKNAIVTYEQVVLVKPDAVEEFRHLGRLYEKTGKEADAIKTYKKYLVKKPDQQAVAKRVGMYEYEQKRYREAIKYLNVVKDPKLQDVAYLVALGDSYFQSKEYNRAADLFEKVRAKKPGPKTLAGILKPLGECYEKAGKDTQAAVIYGEYTSLPGVTDAELSFRKAYLREKSDPAAAAKIYEANTKTFPGDHRNFLRLGLMLSEKKESLEQAARMLRAASRLVDTIPVVWERLGEVSGKIDWEKTELLAYQQLLKLKPQHLQANKRVGAILLKKGQTSQAISNLEMVLTGDSKDVETMLLLAEGYMATKRPAQAAKHLQKAMTLRPDEVKIRLDLIAALEAAGDKEGVAKAEAGLAELDKKIIAKDKKDIASRQRLLAYSLANNDHATAYSLANELAVLTPKDAEVLRHRSQMALKLGKKKEAARHIQDYLALEQKDAPAHVTLGNLLYEQKDLDGAMQAYAAALKLDPRAKGFYKNYVDIVLTKKLEDKAVSVIQGAITAGEADLRAYKALGDIYKKRKQYASAVKMYQKALKEDAKNIEVLTSLARSQAAGGDIKNATVTYEQVVMMNPKATTEYKALGDLHARAKKIDEAMKAYKQYLVKVPSDGAIARKVGLYEHGKKNDKAAIKYLEMVSEAKLKDVTYLAALGEAYYRSGDCAKASSNFAGAWKSKPSPAILKEILKPLGRCYEKMGKTGVAAEAYGAYTKLAGVRDADAAYKNAALREKTDKATAIKIYEANTKLYPKDFRNFLRLGLLYARDKATLPRAERRLKVATALNDTIAEAWETYAEVAGKLDHNATELSAYQKLLKLKPMDLKANRRVGALLLDKNQITQAITNLEMVLTTQPKDVETMLLLADAYEKTNRPAKAIELLEKAKTLKPDDEEIRMHLYTLYEKGGQPTKALAEMKGLIDLTKKNTYRAIYTKDLIARKKYDEALRVARDIKEAEPMNIEGMMLIGDIQRMMGKYAEAVETYKAVLFVKDNHAPALYGRGEAYLGLNELNRAVDYFNKAAKADPKYGLAQLGLAKAAKVQKKTALYKKLLNQAKALEPNHPAIRAELKGGI
jgi:tetratricopeptide (TPR) repeat protein